jgi:zinc protease
MFVPVSCRRCVLALLVIAFLPATAVLAEEPAAESERPFDFRETTLDNGLRVVTLEDFSTPIVAVQVWYHVGSKNEDPARQGFAHMFEHMMFRGTDTLGPEDHFNLIRGVGGRNNAFTSFDFTAYVNRVPSNQLDLALWLEAERMMFLNIDKEGFETERDVVKEERRSRNLNAPYGTIPEQVLPVIITKHPYQWLPIGKIAHLEAAQLDELRHFWDIHYVPGNAALVITGAVTHAEAQEAARAYFGWMPVLPDPPLVTIEEPEQTAERRITLKEPLGPVPAVACAYRTVAQTHPDAVPLQMAMDILTGGESSRLYRELVTDRNLCVMLYGEDFTFEQDGAMGIMGALHPVRYYLGKLNPFRPPGSAILKAFNAHTQALARDGVTDHELEKAKNRMLRGAVNSLLTAEGKASRLGATTIVYGGPDWLNRERHAMESVTNEDIMRVAATYLVPERRTTVTIVPDKRHKYDPNAGVDLESYTPPERTLSKAGITRPDAFPEAPPIADLLEEVPEMRSEEKVLANGLKVVVVPNDEVPTTVVTLGCLNGTASEDPARPGVVDMTLAMLNQGTEHYTAEELADLAEYHAIGFWPNTGANAAAFNASSLSGKLPTALELLAETVRRPTFPSREFRKLKRRRRAELSFTESYPSWQASWELRRQIYGDHPYGRPPTGTSRDVRGINRAHLVEWWQTFMRPDTCVLYVAGDTTPEQAFALAEEQFGDWTSDGPVPKFEVPPVPDRAATHIHLVDNPDAVQSQIRVGQTGPSIQHPDRYVADLLTQVFGGAFGSRLNKAVRIDRGRTYGAGGGLSLGRYAGSFSCSTSTRTDATADILRLVLEVVEGMHTTPATDEELNQAKSYLVGRTAARFETPSDLAREAWFIEHNGLPEDNLAQSLASYRAAGSDDLTRVAQEHIDPEMLTIVVVGDAGKLKGELESIAPVTVVKGRE